MEFSNGAASFTGTVPDDRNPSGVAIDLRGLDADPGVAMGVSFTPWLDHGIGR